MSHTSPDKKRGGGEEKYLLEQRLISLETKIEALTLLVNDMAENQMRSATLIKRLALLATGE